MQVRVFLKAGGTRSVLIAVLTLSQVETGLVMSCVRMESDSCINVLAKEAVSKESEHSHCCQRDSLRLGEDPSETWAANLETPKSCWLRPQRHSEAR